MRSCGETNLPCGDLCVQFSPGPTNGVVITATSSLVRLCWWTSDRLAMLFKARLGIERFVLFNQRRDGVLRASRWIAPHYRWRRVWMDPRLQSCRPRPSRNLEGRIWGFSEGVFRVDAQQYHTIDISYAFIDENLTVILTLRALRARIEDFFPSIRAPFVFLCSLPMEALI